jgi:hypothetical protein
MPEPHEQHNPSGFDPFAPRTGPGEPPGPESAGASRFWEQYSSSRGARNPRNGGHEHDPEPESSSERGREHECLDWCPICRGAEVVRATTPPELRDQWQSLQRDALVMMRALIDAYLQRAGEPGEGRREGASRREPGHRVEDIRID